MIVHLSHILLLKIECSICTNFVRTLFEVPLGFDNNNNNNNSNAAAAADAMHAHCSGENPAHGKPKFPPCCLRTEQMLFVKC